MQRTHLAALSDAAFARWAWAGSAALVAMFLMAYYVMLLQDSVARGAQWRYSQSTAQATLANTPSIDAARLQRVGTSR